MYSYPFTLQLPVWLPTSFVMAENKDKVKLKVQYFIEAEFVPTCNKDYTLVRPKTLYPIY